MTPNTNTTQMLLDLDFDKVTQCHINMEYDENISIEETEKEQIGMYSPGWTNWVLSKLQPDEMFNGSPTVDGLRRFTEEYIGIIVKSTSEVNQVPTPENQHRATVTHTIEIIPHTPSVLDQEGETIRLVFSGSADVYLNNTEPPFNSYPVGTADTRAEGKALRRLLRLRNVVAAEEVTQLVVPENSSGEEKITPQMISFVDVLAKRAGANVKATIEDVIGRKVKTINELTIPEAQKLNIRLNEFQQKKDEIDPKFRGYDENWKLTFSL